MIFSKLNSDIEWLIKDLGTLSLVVKNKDVLHSMILARPKHEHENLESLLEKYIILETDSLSEEFRFI